MRCITCNQSSEGDPAVWHAGMVHPFRPEGSTDGWQTASDGRQTHEPPAPMPAYPFDPVLRQALIDKGVITPDDLNNARAKMEVVTAAFKTDLNRSEVIDHG